MKRNKWGQYHWDVSVPLLSAHDGYSTGTAVYDVYSTTFRHWIPITPLTRRLLLATKTRKSGDLSFSLKKS